MGDSHAQDQILERPSAAAFDASAGFSAFGAKENAATARVVAGFPAPLAKRVGAAEATRLAALCSH
jgi:hypothetical protein